MYIYMVNGIFLHSFTIRKGCSHILNKNSFPYHLLLLVARRSFCIMQTIHTSPFSFKSQQQNNRRKCFIRLKYKVTDPSTFICILLFLAVETDNDAEELKWTTVVVLYAVVLTNIALQWFFQIRLLQWVLPM